MIRYTQSQSLSSVEEEEDLVIVLSDFKKDVTRHLDTLRLDMKYVCMSIERISSSIKAIEKYMSFITSEQSSLKREEMDLHLKTDELERVVYKIQEYFLELTKNNFQQTKRDGLLDWDRKQSRSLDAISEPGLNTSDSLNSSLNSEIQNNVSKGTNNNTYSNQSGMSIDWDKKQYTTLHAVSDSALNSLTAEVHHVHSNDNNEQRVLGVAINSVEPKKREAPNDLDKRQSRSLEIISETAINSPTTTEDTHIASKDKMEENGLEEPKNDSRTYKREVSFDLDKNQSRSLEEFPEQDMSTNKSLHSSSSGTTEYRSRWKTMMKYISLDGLHLSHKAMDEDVVILAEAVWDHVAMEPEELAFRAGEVIEVLDTLDRDWWWGARGDQAGWFPSAFVRLRVSQEDTVEDCLAAIASGGSKQLRRRTSISLLSNDQVRSRVVRELVNTERDFVKVLRDVKEGYLAECRKRSDMFSVDQIGTIFGNLEQLLEFQEEFLEDLERHVDSEAPHRSCLGDTFLRHQAGFRMYSEYCNSHPMAIATLQELYQHNSYSKFFEACRLMRGLIEIPLDGYLLTPVQRICKYPLQLAELLKYTKTDHPDHAKITEALEAMRAVAVLINERKRRMESLEKLAAWQQRVDGWEGEDLIETSSQLIHQGEAIRVTSGMWTNNITLFLFDHQLVYCKKDILKRNTFVYKGRIHLDTSEVINIPDGKEPALGVTVRHGIKVYSCVRDKWLLFCCRSAQDKARWLEGFGEERRLVEQDLRDGLEFAPAARHLARMSAARCYRRPPTKPRNKTYKRGNSDITIPDSSRVTPIQRTNGLTNTSVHGSTNSLGRRVGTWFTFGGNKKSRNLGRAATLQTVVHPS